MNLFQLAGAIGLLTVVAADQRPATSVSEAQRQAMQLRRKGTLKAGDPAPDFDLPRLASTDRVRLSSFKGHAPVALVFGSYT